jgi:putative transposase
MIRFIKERREVCGVEPICRVLQIAPSTFHAHLAVESDQDKASDRAKRDVELPPELKRAWDDNRSVYGAEYPPLKWSVPIVRKTEDLRWPLKDPSPKK